MSYNIPSSSRPEAELLSDNVDYDRDELSKMYRMLGNLAKSIVPSTRKKRDETSKEAERRRELREALEDMGADEIEITNKQLRQSPLAERAFSQERFLEFIRRKAVESTADAHEVSRLITKLRSSISQLSSGTPGSTPRHLSGMLELLHALAFSSGKPISTPSARAVSQTQSRQTDSRAVSQATTNVTADTPVSTFENRRTQPPNGATSRPPAMSQTATPAPPPQSNAKATTPQPQPVSAKSLVEVGEQVPPSQLLQRFRSRLGKQQVSEDDLLRDMIYIMQGINGTHVKFEEEYQFETNTDPADAASGPSKILRVVFSEGESGYMNPPTKRIIHRLAELGQLCNRVSQFRLEREKMATMGSVMKSLCCFISDELAKFYGLIGHLDDQVKASHSGKTQSYITLKRLAQLTEEMTLRFRLMSTVIESCQDAHGGALISLIHSYTFNGDPFIRRFTSRLLDEVSKPFFLSLSLWIYEGELQDPFQEFFVELNSNPHTSGRAGSRSGDGSEAFSFADLDTDAASLWQNKFLFRKEMLPSFLQESFGRKIFSTGKSLNFIRQSCGDGDWVAKQRELGGSGAELRYTDMTGLESRIEQAFTSASKRLLDIFLDDFKLLDHMRALKDYLMLSRGDFVDMLMTSLGPSLNRPANSLFRHNLTASLETAVRGSNAQYEDADILRRLDARILEFSTGDTGWDTFTLEYKVDSPVNTVLDNQAMVGYQIIFSHLWRVKRVELALNTSWLRLHETGSNLRRIKAAKTRNTGPKPAEDVYEVIELLTKVEYWMVKLQEMVQFVRQMQGFAQLEVIEYSWNDLLGFFSHRQGDLDELIQGHRAYLDALIGKVLLRGGGKPSSEESADYLAAKLRGQLDVILSFTLAVGDLTHHVTREVARYDMSLGVQPSISERGARSRIASTATPPASVKELAHADPQILVAVSKRLRAHSDAFGLGMQHLLYDLERHTNLTVRDLAVRLNFNDQYESLSARDTRAKTATATPTLMNAPTSTGIVA